MVTEDYVSYETAKLLKEKGFDEPCYAYWHEDENRLIFSYSMHAIRNITNPCFFGPAVPTLQRAMKWLRKEHNLAISTSITIDGWRSYISQIKLDSEWFVVDIIDGIDEGNIPNCDTYEKACEAAIKYCIENLI